MDGAQFICREARRREKLLYSSSSSVLTLELLLFLEGLKIDKDNVKSVTLRECTSCFPFVWTQKEQACQLSLRVIG